MNHKHVKFNLLLTIFCSVAWSTLSGQTVWPGDITDNGLVNTIDVLCYGIASDSVGPSRAHTSTEWQAEPLPEDWSGSFATGANFSYADCNGDGEVDDDDLLVIDANYGYSRDGMVPDIFQTGDPAIDPILRLEQQNGNVHAGGKAKIKLYLGDNQHEIQNFFGIAFSLYFDPAMVSDEEESIKFRLKSNSFVNNNGGNRATTYLKVDHEAGKLDMVIMRQHLGTSDGSGMIGTFIVVMEDIILFDSEIAEFSVGDIKLIDPELVETLVAPSELDVEINGSNDGNGGNNNNNLSEINSIELRSDTQIFSRASDDKLWVEIDNQANNLEKLEVINEEGEIVFVKELTNQTGKEEINLSKYPKGNYQLKLYTTEGVSEYLLVK